jgi:hypothetical protein
MMHSILANVLSQFDSNVEPLLNLLVEGDGGGGGGGNGYEDEDEEEDLFVRVCGSKPYLPTDKVIDSNVSFIS